MVYGIQVNLTAASTNYNLAALCAAIDSGLTKGVGLEQFHTIILQTVSVAQPVLVGDAPVRHPVRLQSGGGRRGTQSRQRV